MPVFASHRYDVNGGKGDEEAKKSILGPLLENNNDNSEELQKRLHLLRIDLLDEKSVKAASDQMRGVVESKEFAEGKFGHGAGFRSGKGNGGVGGEGSKKGGASDPKNMEKEQQYWKEEGGYGEVGGQRWEAALNAHKEQKGDSSASTSSGDSSSGENRTTNANSPNIDVSGTGGEPSESYLWRAFSTAGMLYPERQPKDLDLAKIEETFRVNLFSHLLLIKHFSGFLPKSLPGGAEGPIAKWVNITARVGSIHDNKTVGGWYSYRSSKAALNQVVKTFDLHLKNNAKGKGGPGAMCVGVHPGTTKTDLSKGYWDSVPKDRLHTPEEAAQHVVDVVNGLKEDQRGRLWDWEGKEILP